MPGISDKSLLRNILVQIEQALQRIRRRASRYKSADDFTASEAGMESLDSICMLFMAIGESLKKVDKLTEGTLLSKYPDIDWKGAIGFRDIIAHQYFDIDSEQVFWICTHELAPLTSAIQKMGSPASRVGSQRQLSAA
jgi:uncharacterized protein with HEPN domain